jgi:hypothetical protein
LKEQALSYFEHHLMGRVEAEDSELPDNDLIELVIRDIGLEYITKRNITCKSIILDKIGVLHIGLNTSIQEFLENQRLNDLNRYLLYFPEEHPKQLDQDEIIQILDYSKVLIPEFYEAMVNN